MKHFLKSAPFKFFVIVICALLVGMIIAVGTTDSVSPFSTVFGTIFKPIQTVAGKASEKIKDFNFSFKSSKTLQNEIDRLNERVENLEKRLADYDEIKHKMESYETILDLKKENNDFKFCFGSVIATDNEDAFGSVVIDKGSKDGIKINDPVIRGNSLVGVVKKVNKTYCVVETILNPEVNISAMESKTRESSFVTSTVKQAQDGRCVMQALERTTAISPGGLILTSGIGGIFPKGLLIGTVTRVLESEYDITSYAVIEPFVDFENLEDVFVITSFDGQGIAVK